MPQTSLRSTHEPDLWYIRKDLETTADYVFDPAPKHWGLPTEFLGLGLDPTVESPNADKPDAVRAKVIQQLRTNLVTKENYMQYVKKIVDSIPPSMRAEYHEDDREAAIEYMPIYFQLS